MPRPVAVLLIGTLDTKGEELAFLRSRLLQAGVDVLLADAGTGGPPHGVEPDIAREEIVPDVASLTDRGEAVSAMAAGAAALAARLYAEGRIDGVLGAGGSGNTAIATAAMRALPVGVPKLMVSTMAAGDTRDYVGGTDMTMMASVTDVAGLNSISARVLANAAAAMAGMVGAPPVEHDDSKPLVGATMFGVTTPCVDHARAVLEARGYEVLVFHATGTGGPRDGGARRVRLPRRRARRDDHRAVRRPRRRRAQRRTAIGWRRRAGRASRRSSRSARWTWSTSARATPCRRSSPTATCTCTTRR